MGDDKCGLENIAGQPVFAIAVSVGFERPGNQVMAWCESHASGPERKEE
jgi:hypothetical protein